MCNWKRWLVLSLAVVVAGCSAPGLTPGGSRDRELADGEAGAAVGYAAAVVGRAYISDPSRYPSANDPKPGPNPSPAPSPNGTCPECFGRNWLGDNVPRKPCPVCNPDGKKPPKNFEHLGQSEVGGYEAIGAAVSEQTEAFKAIHNDLSVISEKLDRSTEPTENETTEAAGEEENSSPFPTPGSPAASGDLSAWKVEPKPEPPAIGRPSVEVFRAKLDPVMVDQWMSISKPLWEKLRWTIALSDLPDTATKSYFLVTDVDGKSIRVDEYLNKDALTRAKAAQSPSKEIH